MKTGSMLLLVTGVAVMNLFAAPTVSDVKARQRYPWNGLVDIDVTVTGCEPGDKTWYECKCNLTDFENGKPLPGLFGGPLQVTNGVNRLILRNGPQNVVVNQMKIQVEIKPLEYQPVQLWVDGPYWASCNIGADKPEEAGLYFWWGDTVGYKLDNDHWVAMDGSKSDFRFCSEGESRATKGKDSAKLASEGWIKNGKLVPEHDAATVHWGNKWRLPTADEINALCNNCTWTWTQRNGMNGYEVRGKGDYKNGYVFIPAVGHGCDNRRDNFGTASYYWSSNRYWDSLYGEADARDLHIDSRSHSSDHNGRDTGFPIRAVFDMTR